MKSIKKGNGWKFDWKYEFSQSGRHVFKLSVKGNPDVIQGLVSYSDEKDHLFMHLIESAPFNIGKRKVYVGVPGNLVAFLCKESWDKGYDGFVAFISKTRLVRHYEEMLNAVHIGNHKIIIFPKEALLLIKRYFKFSIMKLIRESENIAFEVDTRPVTATEKKQISDVYCILQKNRKNKKNNTAQKDQRKKNGINSPTFL